MAALTAVFSQLSNVQQDGESVPKPAVVFLFSSTLSTGPVMLLQFGSALSLFCSTHGLAFWQQPAAGGALKAIF